MSLIRVVCYAITKTEQQESTRSVIIVHVMYRDLLLRVKRAILTLGNFTLAKDGHSSGLIYRR